MAVKLNWDAVGIGTSVLCAIHCALLPVITTTLPVFGIDIIDNMYFEWGMIGLAFFIGCYALYHGFFIHHKKITPFLIFTAGFGFLILKQLFHAQQYWFLAIGVLCIVIAHYYNYKLCHQHRCNSPHHKH
jgi:hypothetical protein